LAAIKVPSKTADAREPRRQVVAKVIIRRVEQKIVALPTVVPGWKLGELIEGDVVPHRRIPPLPKMKFRAAHFLLLLALAVATMVLSGCASTEFRQCLRSPLEFPEGWEGGMLGNMNDQHAESQFAGVLCSHTSASSPKSG